MKTQRLIVIILSLCFQIQAQDNSKDEITIALNKLNYYRHLAGLDSVKLSDKLSDGCNKHAKYLVKNKNSPKVKGLEAHKEYKTLAGFSKEGMAAGKNSVIHYVKPTEAISGWINTFYHRVPLLQPNLKEIGIGYCSIDTAYPVSIIDCITGLKGECTKEIVFYPNEKQKNVPTTMGPEIPHPAGKEGEYGFPITVFFTKWQKIKKVTFRLSSATEKSIECFVSSPEKPATSFDQWNTICVIPKKKLKNNTEYTVDLTCLVDEKPFTKTYKFCTGQTN